jgi:hypothetical protein
MVERHTWGLEAIECNDDQLTDDLVVIHPVVDAGPNIHLSSQGGTMDKPCIGHSIPILRDGKKWLVDLEELKNINIKGKPLYIVIMLVSQVTVMEAMCTAINSSAWLR